MAAKGYPDEPQRGSEIRGLDAAASDPKVKIFHAGTRRDGDRLLADGGRVLGVTALGTDLAAARERRLRRGRPDPSGPKASAAATSAVRRDRHRTRHFSCRREKFRENHRLHRQIISRYQCLVCHFAKPSGSGIFVRLAKLAAEFGGVLTPALLQGHVGPSRN